MSRSNPFFDLLNHEQYALIGEVAVASAQLELTIAGQIGLILRLTDADQAAIVPVNLSGRLEMWRTIAMQRVRSKKRKNEFTKLVGELKQLSNNRNSVIHGTWGPLTGIPLNVILKIATGEANFEPPSNLRALGKKGEFPAARLEQLVIDLVDAGRRIWKFAKATYLRPRILSGRAGAVRKSKNTTL